MREDEIRKLHVRSKDIAAEFAKAIVENKFHDFLQKIFKKKYTAARERDGIKFYYFYFQLFLQIICVNQINCNFRFFRVAHTIV